MKKLLLVFILFLSISGWGQSTFIKAPTISRYSFSTLPTVASMMATGKTITVIGTMDSLMASGDFFAENLIELFTQNYGYCGGGGSLADMSFGPYIQNGKVTTSKSAGASYVYDVTRWWGNHYLLPAGELCKAGIYNTTFGTGYDPFVCNVIEITFAASNTYGGFSVQTNSVVLANIVCNTNVGILETNITVRYTNSGGAYPIQLTLTCLSNSVRIMQMGLYNYTKPGAIWISQAMPAHQIDEFNNSVPSYAKDAAWRGWNPDLVFLKTVNGGSVIISNGLAPFVGFVLSNCPNANFSASGIHALEIGDTDIIAENVALQKFFQGRPDSSYWPEHDEFGNTYTVGKNLGYNKAGTDAHTTVTGAELNARGIWDYMNLLNLRGRRPPGNFANMPHRINTAGEIRFSGGTTYTDTNAFGVYSSNNLVGGIDIGGMHYGTEIIRTIGTNSYPVELKLFQMTTDGSCTNITTTTNTLWGAGSGSRRIDTNFWQVGREITAEMDGNYFDGATPGQIRLMVMLNTASATNIAAQVLFTPVANITTGDNFRIRTKSICRTTGATGTISTSGCIEIDNAGTPTLRYFTNNVITIDTTAQLTFEIASTNGAPTDSLLARNGSLMLH